jgi:hypothetical protein
MEAPVAAKIEPKFFNLCLPHIARSTHFTSIIDPITRAKVLLASDAHRFGRFKLCN